MPESVKRTEYLNDPQNETGYSQVIAESEKDLLSTDPAATVKRIIYQFGHERIRQTTFIYNNGAWNLADPETFYFGRDGHGSTRALIDGSNATISINNQNAAYIPRVFAYDAYGNPLGFDPAQADTHYLYNGEALDRTNLIYLRARYYDLRSGRFLTVDPFVGNMYDPQSLHKYTFCFGNPQNLTDPNGMFPGFVSPMARWLLGIFVHTFLGRAYEATGIQTGLPGTNRWGNRWISTIASDVGFLLGFPLPLKPDMAGVNGVGFGEIYEIKPGEILTYYMTPTFVAAGSEGFLQAILYRTVLNSVVPSQSWNLGKSCWNGVTEWPGFTMVPGWVLVTFADYSVLPGVL